MSVMTTHPPIPRPSAPRRLPRGVIVCAAGITVGLLAAVLLPGAAFADEVRDGQWYLDTLNVHDAHELSQGAGVTIGVIDSGIDPSHVDIEGRVFPGTDLVYSDRDGLSDDSGHGTAVASLLVGDNDADGVMGMAPAATVLSVNIFEDDAKTSDPLLMGPAIHWLIDNGADVISISVGGGGDGATQAAIDRAVDNNIPIVAAVSNRYADVGYGREEQTSAGFPAALPRVIPVTATARDSKFWEGSVDLSQTASQPRFGIAAPGVDIPIALPGNNYDTVNGTSLSAPIVAGTLALIKSAYPDLDYTTMVARLIETVDDKGPEGYDDKYGWGVVNPLAALTEDVVHEDEYSSIESYADDILPLEEQGKQADGDGPAVGEDEGGESGASVGDDEAGADAGVGVGVPVWAWITVAAAAVLGAGVIAALLFHHRNRTRAPVAAAPISTSGPPPRRAIPNHPNDVFHISNPTTTTQSETTRAKKQFRHRAQTADLIHKGDTRMKRALNKVSILFANIAVR